MIDEEIKYLSFEALKKLIENDKCPYEPQQFKKIGIEFLCPVCGVPVISGINHTRITNASKTSK